MSYLLTQMLFYLVAALLLGLLLGWILWGRRTDRAAGVAAEVARLHDENHRLRRELEVKSEIDARQENRPVEILPADADVPAAQFVAAEPKAQPTEQAAKLMAKPSKPSGSKGAGKKPVAATASKPTKPILPRKQGAPIQPDNLRRIVGIGPVNERLLHGEGVRTFVQIAKWTAADVRRIETLLQFDGRVERERWIEQAKLLAAGNEAEFAAHFPSAGSSRNT